MTKRKAPTMAQAPMVSARDKLVPPKGAVDIILIADHIDRFAERSGLSVKDVVDLVLIYITNRA